MGIENSVVAKYGQDYWEKNKKDILRTANKNRNLNTGRVRNNARARRSAERAEKFGGGTLDEQIKSEMRLRPELYNASDLKKAGVIDAKTYRKIRSKPKRNWKELLKGLFSV